MIPIGEKPMPRSTCIALLWLASTTPAQIPEPILLKAARLYDGAADTAVTPGRVLVRDGKIAAAGNTEIEAPDARVLDFGDATLCPGFIDCHVHLVYDSGTDWTKDAMDGL